MHQLLLAGAAAGFFFFAYVLPRGEKKLRPPGPHELPLIGNLHQFPRSHIWIKLEEWGKQYGPIFSLNLAGQNVIVLGSHQVAHDLFAKQSTNFSDRPRNHVAQELLFGGLFFLFSSNTEFWKKSRRIAHEALKPQVTKKYQPITLSDARITVQQVLEAPEDFEKHLRRSNVSVTFRCLYGHPTLDPNDPDIRRINEIGERGAKAATPGEHLVEFFTWMECLPDWLAPWRVWAKDWFKKDSEFLENLFEDVQTRMSKGEQRACVATSLLEDEETGLTHREKAWNLATIFTAASVSTAAALTWCVLAMTAYPDVQVAAQKELDDVVGRDRMPDFDDFESLPTIRAIAIEIHRWRPIAPLSVPHCTSNDDEYGGYFIPKGTMCIPNVWMMNRDPSVYGPDADDFRPSRHLDPTTGQLLPPVPLTHHESQVTYGFGRRICVGRHLANQSLFINIASFLWAFKFSSIDGEPLPLGPTDCTDGGLTIRPLPFKCKIEPRFRGVQNVMIQTKDNEWSQ
ncbi:cytochrome P450 [Flagelloscypha sp. PMI_526]|nr:cytochrome P450 [Flagelloscypha sp. PMI_526]